MDQKDFSVSAKRNSSKYRAAIVFIQPLVCPKYLGMKRKIKFDNDDFEPAEGKRYSDLGGWA